MNPRTTALLLALVPALAGAQTAPPARPPPADATADGAAEDARPTVDLTRKAERLEGVAVEPPGAEAKRRAAPGEAYEIQKGDTLWDISAKYLESPWQWPRLWSLNPQIENPHWIYPGNPLRLAPGEAARPPEVAELPETAPRPEVGDLSRGSMDRAQPLDDEDTVTVGGKYGIAQGRGRGPAVLRNSFVTSRQLEASGTIAAAFEEKMFLTQGDRVYGRFRHPGTVQVGQRYSVYRTEGAVVHPVTKRFVGYKTVILGTARVTAAEAGKDASLVITYSNDTIERGDRIGPAVEEAQKPLFVRPNATAVNGYVIGVQPAIVTGAAEYNVVYLDKGRADGVDVGNTFEVVRSGDPLLEPPDRPLNVPGLPREVIGHLVVFDAQDVASSAYVRRSLGELLVGDHVEMRPAPPPAPARKGG